MTAFGKRFALRCVAAVFAAGVLAGCQDRGVLEPGAQGGPQLAANPQAGAENGAAHTQRLAAAGRPGLKRGVNLPTDVPIPAADVARVEANRPAGFQRSPAPRKLEVRNAMWGETALHSPERKRVREAYGRTDPQQNLSATTSTTQSTSGSLGLIYVASWSDVYHGAFDDDVHFESGSQASEPLDYIDVTGDSYMDGRPVATLFDYGYYTTFVIVC